MAVTMCGIVGILHRSGYKPVDPAVLVHMNSLLVHRGPDDVGTFVQESVGLAHRRLAVIDLASGHQPMIDQQSGRVLVYNGEIYNYKELRQTLKARRIAFKTASDTEVLLALADTTSFDWLTKLIGMFAFALWEPSSRTLLLVRDRFGKKPLYYANSPDMFLFASEIKALLAHPMVRPEVNVDRIPEYIAFRTISGNATLFQGIQEVPPGHAMLVRQKDLRITTVRYWEDTEDEDFQAGHVDSLPSLEDQLSALLMDSVKYRLVSDVPVGTYNSGGVDSSLITAMVRAQTRSELHTFSVGFQEAPYDERKYAERIAQELHTRHHTLVIDERQYLDNLEKTLWHLDEPINHAHTVPLLLLSALAKQFVTVVLTGEGSDEVFGGYPRYHIPLLVRHLSRLPTAVSSGFLALSRATKLRKLTKLFEVAHDFKQSVMETSRYVPMDDLRALLPDYHSALEEREAICLDAVGKPGGVLEKVLYFDRRTYLPSLLMRLDKATMAASLEARTPFLDHRLVHWSCSLPAKQKLALLRHNKVLVKKLATRWIPRELVYRPKVGFGVPLPEWFRNPKGLGRYLELLTDKTFREREYFDSESVIRLIGEHQNKVADHSEALWGLVNFELWCRLFIDSKTAAVHKPLTTSASA